MHSFSLTDDCDDWLAFLAPARQAHSEGVNIHNDRITYIGISKGVDGQDSVKSLFAIHDCPRLAEELHPIPEEEIAKFKKAALDDTMFHWIIVFDKCQYKVSVAKVSK